MQMQSMSIAKPLTPKQLTQIHAQIITSLKPDLLNSLLRTLTLSTNTHEALTLYTLMLHNPTFPDHFTHVHALKACSLIHAFPNGHQIHAHIIKSGYHSNIFIQNSLIRLYADAGDVVAARRALMDVSWPDVVSWTSLISGFSRSGCEEEAVLAFGAMSVKPNAMTLVSVLSACSHLRALRWGRAIHGHSLRNLSSMNIFVANAILDMYMKCGSLGSAWKLFDAMGDRDVVSWTTVVSGYAQHKCCEEAIRVFHMMIQGGGVEPNEATLVSVLSACSSLGAIGIGRWVHAYMNESQVRADGHVGNALLNMYAKCGDMGMAFEVFRGLKCKDLVSWSSIIGGMALNGHGMHALQLFAHMLCHGIHPDDVTFIGLLSACSHAGLVDQGLQFFRAMTDVYNIVPRMEHCSCMVDIYGRAGLLEEAEAFIREMPIEADGEIWGSLLSSCKIHGNEEIGDRTRRHLLGTRCAAGGGTYALLSNAYARIEKWKDANDVRETMRGMGIRKTPGLSWIDVDGCITFTDKQTDQIILHQLRQRNPNVECLRQCHQVPEHATSN